MTLDPIPLLDSAKDLPLCQDGIGSNVTFVRRKFCILADGSAICGKSYPLCQDGIGSNVTFVRGKFGEICSTQK